MSKPFAFELRTKEVHCINNCLECPYFLRLDICGYESSSALNREECAA